jgi:hypothetical protein
MDWRQAGRRLFANAPWARKVDRGSVDASPAVAQQREAMSGLGAGMLIDQDESQWQRLTGGKGQRMTKRDLTPLQQDRVLEIAWYLWEQNPLARRLIGLMTDLVVGEGVTVHAKDPKLQEQIDLTWHHRVNQLAARHRPFYSALSLNGELILPAVRNPITGRAIIGYIDPYQVQEVIPDPENVLIPDIIRLKPSAGEVVGKSLKVIRENPESELLEGEVFFFPINNLPNSSRGRSDFLPLADWLDVYDQYLFAEVERVNLLSNWVWDLNIKGATKEQIRERLREFPAPKPGAIFGHNENETLEARTPSLQAADRSEVSQVLRTHIAGAMGFPTTYLGDSGGSTRSTIEGQNDVMMKTPVSRQKEYQAFLKNIVLYSIQGAVTANPVLFRGLEIDAFQVEMPEIAAKDVARVGGVVANVMSAMDTGLANGTISKRAAVVTQCAVIKHLGVDLDPSEVLDEAEQEKADQQAVADEKQAALAKANAARIGGSELPADIVAAMANRGKPAPPVPPTVQ